MPGTDPVTRETVDRVCALANLDLTAERRARLVPMFASLVAAANDLSRKMADPGVRSVLPITRFPEQ